MCQAVDNLAVDKVDEFYDGLATSHIKAVDSIINTLVLDQAALQKLKGTRRIIFCGIIFVQNNVLFLILMDLIDLIGFICKLPISKHVLFT